jgi:hypothetical protein
MTEPLDDLAERLFHAAREDEPRASAKKRTIAAIRTRVPQRKRRPAVVGYLLAAAAAVGLFLALRGESVTSAVITGEPVSSAQKKTLKNTTERAPAAAERRAEDAAPEAPRPRDRARRAEPPAPKVNALELADELLYLKRARSELTAGNPTAALTTLDDYDRAPKDGQLTAEAALLRIEALSRAGQHSAAAENAERFVRANPNHALADRARAYTKTSGTGGSGN